jgi:hypothetical protein
MKPVARPSTGTTPTAAKIERESKAKRRQQPNHTVLQSVAAEPSGAERNPRRQKPVAEKSAGIKAAHETKGRTYRRTKIQHRLKLRKMKIGSTLRKLSGNLDLANGICSATEGDWV